jgi:GH15 family glucan-1,4-alpha-glucosidase
MCKSNFTARANLLNLSPTNPYFIQISKYHILITIMSNIQDYYIIGDLYTAALVSHQASIDWLCLPYFDSPSVFANLLDPNAGACSLDTTGHTITSSYIPDTAIVEFQCATPLSSFQLHDFMLPQPTQKCHNHLLIRKFLGLTGQSHIRLHFNPKPDYARNQNPSMIRIETAIQVIFNDSALVFHVPQDATCTRTTLGYQIEFTLHANQQKLCYLEYFSKGDTCITRAEDWEQLTSDYWQEWISHGNFFDFCNHQLKRSAITLKLMQFYPTGAIVAAPTTSLPETIGGIRNWDYRYVWIRDATFTLYALYILGYTTEAENFFTYIHSTVTKIAEDQFDLHVMYTIWGEPVPSEHSLDHLSGFQHSTPVRVGNGAGEQFQLDIYGSLIDAYYFASKHDVPITAQDQALILKLTDKIAQKWTTKDNGIWEIRAGLQHYTYSKVMCWLGIDRTIRLRDKLSLTQPQVDQLTNLAHQIQDWIWQNCYDPNQHNFLQYPAKDGCTDVDATNLLFPPLQFLNRHHRQTADIITNTADKLTSDKIFVYRYHLQDGLSGNEGAFVLCTYWLISALAMVGQHQQAHQIFAEFTHLFQEHGLYPEEIDPDTHNYLGNYPQAFSHIGYIMSAYYLHRYSPSQH